MKPNQLTQLECFILLPSVDLSGLLSDMENVELYEEFLWSE